MGENENILTEEQAKEERANIESELWGEETLKVEEEEKVDLGNEETAEVITGKKEDEPVDPWAGVNPTLKAEFLTLKEKASLLDQVEARLKQAERRIGSVTNELHEANKTAAALKKQAEDAPTEEEIKAAAESDAEWEGLKEAYPEWAGILEKKLALEANKTKKQLKEVEDLKNELATIKEKSGGQSGPSIDEIRADIRKDLVSQRYPKWEEDVKSQNFGVWIKTQDEETIKKCNSDNPFDAIEVLDKFHNKTTGKNKSAAEIEADRKQRLKNSEVQSNGRVRQPAKKDDDMTELEYRQKAAKEVWTE